MIGKMEKKTMLAGKKKNSSQNRISQITATILVLLLLANVMTVYLLSKNLVFAQLVRRNVMGAGPIIAGGNCWFGYREING